MYLDKLAPAWREFQQKLLSRTCILVVDDEPVIQELLAEILTREGFKVECASNATEGWEILSTRRIDLAIVDKNLPDQSGLSIIQRIRDEDLAVPSILITGYASTETVAEALEAGASDYISKPFDDVKHLVTRIRSVLDRRTSQLLFDVMITDLTRAALQGEAKTSPAFAALSRELISFKLSLGRRPQVLIGDEDELAADALSDAMRSVGLSSIIADGVEELEQLVGGPDGPLVIAVALELPQAPELIRKLRSLDSQIEILVTATRGNLRQALAAVSAGAADYALRATEGEQALTMRLRRLVERARRHRLYLHLLATLYRTAKVANPKVIESLVFAAPGQDIASYVQNSPPLAAAEQQDVPDLGAEYLEGGRIDGNPLGSAPLRRRN